MTALILQCRLDSSRLPGKALLPLGEKPMVLRVMEALKQFPCDTHILACSDDSSTALGPLAKEAGFALVPGPKNDVLRRFCIALEQCLPGSTPSSAGSFAGCSAGSFAGYSGDWVIRATADNPFVFTDAAEALYKEALERKADYAGYSGLPYGAGVEVINAQALFRSDKEASDEEDREHVCPYLYKHPELFRLHRPLAPLYWQGPEIRLTVDTPADYETAQLLYNALITEKTKKRNQGELVITEFRKTFQRVNP
ncbi:spore coat polysaccharide biosynthesis protein SpsF [Treponema primitia ZAS-2]|uniref:Spore coat polysaccharide biosynthesis protein SpsF n=1 Tax=Treponema primitia (strain ATCC BAA-887 / DSM 12427 / ZAS-2) TaxID=545694 RepID=F5YH41_TREPZ|nr:NTP transferase domain-containing protein [Treponema primitia]AEF85364.1 spore coat polysaccharide biosynthesis protein SpsF [Treponema primitia ZAS-2]